MNTRNLKALGLALVAVLAMSTLAAAGAGAEVDAQLTLESSEGTADATQVGTGRFTRFGKSVSCENGHSVAHVQDGDTAITMTDPDFDNCTGPLGLPAEFDMKGCHFHYDLTADSRHTFTAIASIKGCATTTQGPTHLQHLPTLVVYNGSETSVVCEYQIGEQEGLTRLDVTNEAASGETPKDWLKVHVEITEIASTRTAGGNLICGGESDENGVLEAEWEWKGTDSMGNSKNLTVSTDG